MKKYQITNQRDLRAAFWQYCDECGIDYAGKKAKFDLDLNMTFTDWKDILERDGTISKKLCDNSLLYTE